MAREREERRQRKRAGSAQRDAKHRAGGDWTTISIPEGIDIFTPKEGTVRMDIVPYEAAEGNPYAQPGEWYYERTYFVHARCGPNNESWVCPSKTSKERCPICEHRAALAKDPDADEALIKSLKPKERQLFLVHVHSKDGDDGKVQLYESSYHTFGKLLDKKRADAEEDEQHIVDFDDPDAGATLKVSYSEEDAGGYSFIEAYSIEFKPRANGLDEELLQHGICLDKVVKVLPYDELKRLFFQEPASEDEEEEPKSKGKTKAAKPSSDDDWDEEEEPKAKTKQEKAKAEEKTPAQKAPGGSPWKVGQKVRHRTHGICEIIRISGDGTSLTLEDEEGETHRAIGNDEVRAVEQKAQEAKKEKAKPAPKDEDDEEPWDDEDDEPKAKAKAKQEKAKTKAAKPASDDDWD